MKNIYLNEFERFLISENNYSENTRLSYMRDLRQLANFLSVSVEEANFDCLENYINIKKKQGSSSATVRRTIASIKLFYRFLYDRGVIIKNPTEGLPAVQVKQQQPQILTYAEVEQLLDQPRCVDLKGYRDKAMLEVLYATGIRVSELIELTLSDVNLEAGTIICRNDKNVREIPLRPTALKALNEYMSFIRKQMIHDLKTDILFVNTNGKPMTRQGFWKILKTYQTKAGIEKNITPHTLRHSFAAHLSMNRSDLKSIKQIMGHSDIATTQLYSQVL